MDRKFLVTTTAITAFASAGMVAPVTPAAAADPVKINVFSPQPVSGYVEAYGSLGYAQDNDCCGTGSFGQIGGAGRLNYWMSPTKALQLDAYGTGVSKDGDGDTAFGLAAHWAKRDPNRMALGLMASVGALFGDFYGTIAIQGQHYSGPWTFYGQAGITTAISYSGDRFPYLAFQARYFTNPNTMIAGDVTIADYDGAFFGQIGLGIEHRTMNTPFSFFARAQGSRWSDGGYEATTGQVIVGAKLWVNQNTLQSNDRNGATFLDLNPMYGEFANKFAF
jgi:hypothetical protein